MEFLFYENNVLFFFRTWIQYHLPKMITVTSTEVKPNVTPILQPFTSTEEKSAPVFDVSSNIYISVIVSVKYI